MKKIVLFIFCASLFSCSTNKDEKNNTEISKNDSISWTIDTGLVHPESVLLASDSSYYLVSNIGTDESDSTPNGFISKVSLDGKILELKWLDSIQSPKGQAIFGEKYYVSALDELIEVSLKTGKILNRFGDKSIVFLNDVCVDNKGKVYVSDMKGNAIFCLNTDKKLEKIFQSNSMLHPNGVFWQNDFLYIGGWGKSFDGDEKGYFMKLDLSNSTLKNIINEKLGRLDGIQSFEDSFLVSSWQDGILYKISKTGEVQQILKSETSLGDFLYNSKDQTLILPLNFQNKLVKTSLK